MAQDLIKAGGDEAAQLHARVASLYAGIDRDERNRCDTLPAKIDGDTRKQLQDYRRNLHGRLQPISNSMNDREKASSAIALFLGGYLNARTSDPGGTTRAYVAVLMDQPLFAIMEGLDDFRRGRVFDIGREGERIPFTLDHAPSAPRVLDQVKKRAGVIQEECYKVKRLLLVDRVAEPEVSDAERNRVAVHMRTLADTLAMKSAAIRGDEMKKARDEAGAARDRAARIIRDARGRRADADFASQVEQANG